MMLHVTYCWHDKLGRFGLEERYLTASAPQSMDEVDRLRAALAQDAADNYPAGITKVVLIAWNEIERRLDLPAAIDEIASSTSGKVS
jgi:hypothetical protein